MADALSPLLPWIIAPPLTVAALTDIATRTIPDRCAVALGVIGLGLQAWGAGAVAALASAGAGACVFALAFLAWRRGWLGGGDVKLLAAAACVVPPAAVGTLLLAVAIAGGALSFLYLVLRAARPAVAAGRPRTRAARVLRAEAWRIRRGGPLPYGVAIAAGTILVATSATA